MADDYKDLKDFSGLIKKLQKDYSKELIKIGNDTEIKGVDWWELDSPKISNLLGKGLPKGRIIEIFGDPGTGKSSLCYYLAAQVQKQNGKILYLDAEMSVDKDYAEQMGLDLSNLILVQPDYGEQCYDIANQAIESNQIDLVVIDSIAALVPKAELEGDMLSNTIGLMARNNSQFLRKVVSLTKKNNATILAVSQNRMKIGCISPNTNICWI